ncbi:MAG TPA: hypothetical protein VGB22_00770 [candidate division Zixibacteria bacterium]|jgi:3-methyladenine DNA glycosylase Tag
MTPDQRTVRDTSADRFDDDSDVAILDAEPESPYRYYVEDEKPRADAAFFELLLARIVRGGGDADSVREYWPRVVTALSGFNAFRLAYLSESEVASSIQSVGGRFSATLGSRARDIIAWAEAFWRVRQIYGSFRQYIRSFDTDGIDAMLADMTQRLPGLSREFLTEFLHEAGERLPSTGTQQGGRSRRQRQGRGRRQQPKRQQPEPPKAESAPTSKAQPTSAADADKSGPNRGNKRGRRRFFRRRRGRQQGGDQEAKTKP